MKVEKGQVLALAEVLKESAFHGDIVTFRRFGDRDPRIQVNSYYAKDWKRKARRRRITVIGARGGLTIRDGDA
jgi:hypothetical protein